jgi:glycosyltransferase involved in cell wall biosynthesis
MASDAPVSDRPRVSACIITLDEEDRIADCIESVDWCDEVVVVDSHSSDRTREIAAGMGARVIERDWPGHVAQKEFAIRAAQNDWVFCIDADERVSPPLRAEIVRLRDGGFAGAVGWKMPRMSSYLGKWIRHGTWYPDLSLRLFDRRHGHWGGNDPHDRVELDRPPGRLVNRLLHHPYRNFAEHLQTIDRYTTIMAQGLRDRNRRARLSDVVLRPGVRFFRFYVLKAGFLEGWRGLLLAYLAAHYVRLKYAKLLVLQRQSKLLEAPEDDGRG